MSKYSVYELAADEQKMKKWKKKKKKKRKKKKKHPNINPALLIRIFLTICMQTFSFYDFMMMKIKLMMAKSLNVSK